MPRCPSIADLERLLEEPAGAGGLGAHVAGCAKCGARMRRIEQNQQFLKGLRQTSVAGLRAAARTADERGEWPAGELAGFTLGRELYRGGQGVIYEARQTATKRTVAIKMLLAGTLATSRQRRRFEREIEIAASLRHPGIVTIFESGVTRDGRHWFAMERVDGIPLDAYLRDRRPALRDVIGLLAQVCDAVNYAHQRGIIHRDLKPANILVGSDGRPHVLDFGLAKALGDAASDSVASATQAGEFMGTFAYAAPEQFEGAPNQIDTRTDVYALGAILYEAVTGAHPFPATGSLPEFIRAVNERRISAPSSHVAGLGAELDAVVLCALAREPERRYQSAGALGQDLLHALAGEPVEARRDSRWYLLRKTARRHRLPIATAVAIVLLVGALAVNRTLQAERIAIERDKALMAEHATARAAESLAAALRESNIERGRLLARSGGFGVGEQLIMREWAKTRATAGASSRPGDAWPPDDAAYWAARELYAASPCRQTIRVAGTSVLRAALSHDRRKLAVGLADGRVLFWSLPDMTPQPALQTGELRLSSVGFTPDGARLFTGTEGGELILWDLATRRLLSRVAAHADSIIDIRCAVSGTAVVTLGREYRMKAWTLGGAPLAPALADAYPILASDVDAAGRRALLGGPGDRCSIMSLTRAPADVEFPASPGPRQTIAAARFSPGGDRVALGRGDGSTEVWDISPRRLLWRSRMHQANTVTVEFSPDGTLLASAGRDRQVRIVAVEDGRLIRTLSGHTDTLMTISFFDGQRGLATSAIDGCLKIWETALHPDARVIARHAETAFSVAFSPDGRWFASCSAAGDDRIRVCEAATGQVIRVLKGHEGIVTNVAFNRDGSLLASCGFDRTVRLWRMADGACLATLAGHENFVETVAFCDDDRRLVSASDDATVRLWDVPSGRCLSVLRGHTRRCPMAAVSPDGTLIASCSADFTIRLWSAADGAPRGVLNAPRQPLRAVCFTPDGRSLISGGDEAVLRVWDLASRECVATMVGVDEDVFAIAVSPDGRFAASGTRGGTVQLWSRARRAALARITENGPGVFSVCFSPDGRSLATGMEDGSALLWDLAYFDSHIAGNIAEAPPLGVVARR